MPFACDSETIESKDGPALDLRIPEQSYQNNLHRCSGAAAEDPAQAMRRPGM